LHVTVARDARAAQRQVEERTFDLVICDVALPGGSGLAVLRELRTRDAQVPVVLLCGAESPPEEAAGLGAFCLEKPVDLESLLRTALKRIRGHASRRARPAARTERTRAVAATVAKNQFGRLLGTAVRGGRVVITKHDAPTAVLMSFDEYQELTGADAPDLDALTHEFDELMARMQTPAAQRATEALFRAETAELAEAALAEARRDTRSSERG
jgi:prevent-host-death family protein